MDSNEFHQAISDGKINFRNEKFTSNISFDSIQELKIKNLKFQSCIFERKAIFRNASRPFMSLTFYNCEFTEVNLKNCDFLILSFINIVSINRLSITDCSFSQVNISTTKAIDIKEMFLIADIKQLFNCRDLKISKGDFKSCINTNQTDKIYLESNFYNSQFENFEIEGRLSYLNFQKVKIENSANFINCNLNEKAFFNDTNFGNEAVFNSCQFESVVSFKNCTDIDTNIAIEICTFKNHVYFTNADFNQLNISDTAFESRVSFDSLQVNNIKLHLVNFYKSAHFDDIRIRNISQITKRQTTIGEAKEWRRTLRAIKQELQRTDNKIDYNRFRNYELSAYYKELKWNENFKDKFILGATKLTTGFDYSWSRALAFIVLSGLFWYSLLYFFEFYIALDLNNDTDFTSGAFRFFLITDFYSPFLERTYLNNGWSWSIFVIGKIFIAFGIYEMIQSFRKFKA